MRPQLIYTILVALIIFVSIVDLYGQSRPVYTGEQNDPGPGMAKVEGVVKSLSPDTIGCGKAYDGTIEVEVVSLLSKGRGFTQNLSAGQVLKLGYNELLFGKNKPDIGMRIRILIKETMCTDSIGSPFMIISIQIF